MMYVSVTDNMRHASAKSFDFFKENEEKIKKYIRKIPICIEFKNGDVFLFMSEVVFRDWEKGRRNFETLYDWEMKQNN